MCLDTIAKISGVGGNQIEASLEVCTYFYPIVSFSLSMKNSEEINKISKLFTENDLSNNGRKSYLEEIEYQQLDTKYVVPYLGMTPSLTEDRVFILACKVVAGKNNSTQSGAIHVKMKSPIKGLSVKVVPAGVSENVSIEDTFLIELTVTKNADISQGEFNAHPLILTVENEGEKLEVGRINIFIVPELKQFIYLLGSSTYGTTSTFTDQMKLRKKSVLKAIKTNEKYVFYVIDIPKGKIHKYEHPGKTQGELFTDLGEFDPISKKNYIDKRFVSGEQTIISKNNVYSLIEKIGYESPSTILEFVIFSHSYNGGPILVNSNYLIDGLINTDDHDMRMGDYKNININFFKKAFCPNGAIYVLGCNSSPHLNNILKQIMKSEKYKSNGTCADDTVFTVNDISFYGTKISDFVHDKKQLGNNKFEITMLSLKQSMSYFCINSYAAYMAKFIDILVVSCLPSTYSIFIDPNTKKPIEFRVSDDTKKNVSFFNTYLGIEITEGNYGKFRKINVGNIERQLNVTIE